MPLPPLFNALHRTNWVSRCAQDIPKGSKVLDVGAGTAPYRDLFSHCDYKAHDFGMEPSTHGRYTKLDFQSDILAIPALDASFDVVLCTEVLEHVPKPIEALKELSRILRPGGMILITAPLGSWLHQEPYHYYGGYTPHWYRRFLAEANFEEIQIQTNMGFFSFFGQEATRFSALIDPRRTPGTPIGDRVLLASLWVATLPIFRVFLPIIAPYLDRLRLESICTVGYHVKARKVRPHPAPPAP